MIRVRNKSKFVIPTPNGGLAVNAEAEVTEGVLKKFKTYLERIDDVKDEQEDGGSDTERSVSGQSRSRSDATSQNEPTKRRRYTRKKQATKK